MRLLLFLENQKSEIYSNKGSFKVSIISSLSPLPEPFQKKNKQTN